MNKKAILGAAVSIVCAGLLTYSYWFAPQDMTGAPYADIAAKREAFPHKTITYTVTIDDSLSLTESDTAVTLTAPAQADSLTAQAEYLQGLTAIDFGDTVPTADQLLALQSAFPNARVSCHAVILFDQSYPTDTTELTLNGEQTDKAAAVLPALPKLTDVYLDDTVTLDLAAALYTAHPHLTYHYTVKLFGKTVSTDMETVEYFKADIGDQGLTELRKLLPMMYNLTQLTLDWCGTSDEATARLRDDFAEDFKVVWRLFIGDYNVLTDSYKFWGNYLTNQQAADLQYLTEVKYMDIGHSQNLTDIEFFRSMPDLEVLILGDCRSITSLEPLRGCTKMEYLEMYRLQATDLSPLSAMTELEHLNISEMSGITDISCLMELDNLKRLWSNNNPQLVEQARAYGEAHPDCTVLTNGGHPVFYHWRYTDSSRDTYTPRYALLRRQIGYANWDESRWPKGHVRTEITYESTGIKEY